VVTAAAVSCARDRRLGGAERQVPDPEVPALSRWSTWAWCASARAADGLEVVLTPTYSGCPATEVIEQSVLDAIAAAGLGPVRVSMRSAAPAWTTDWISAEGRASCATTASPRPAPVAADGAVPIRIVGRPRRRRDLPALRQRAHRAPVGLRLHRLQGAAPLPDCREPFEHFKPI
jgi:ring-1,2-phenylacetyl-CoA epoxidase subunit PaaD